MEIYLVTGILVIIWVGLFSYIFSLDKKVKKLESEFNHQSNKGEDHE